jgi:hypothetical protein
MEVTMTVNNLQTGYNAYNSYAQNQTQNHQHIESSADSSEKIDRVTISDEAKRLSMLSDEKKLPLEANALPKWFDKYIPSSSVQSNKLDNDFWNFLGGLTNDSTISSDEKAQIKQHLQNDPSHQWMLVDAKFASEHKSDIKNYLSSLKGYFKAALKENGVTSKQDYYHKVILNKDTSEQVHKTMASKIENDSKIKELMNILGVKS